MAGLFRGAAGPVFTLGDEEDLTLGEDVHIPTSQQSKDPSSASIEGSGLERATKQADNAALKDAGNPVRRQQEDDSNAHGSQPSTAVPVKIDVIDVHQSANGNTASNHTEHLSNGDSVVSKEIQQEQMDQSYASEMNIESDPAALKSHGHAPDGSLDRAAGRTDAPEQGKDIPGQAKFSAELDQAEEERIAEELAALEAEAEALALEDQRKSSAPAGNGAVHLDRYSVSLADESQAHRAMVEAQQEAQQATHGTAALQSALDNYEPRARPFSPPPGAAPPPLHNFSTRGEFIEPPEFQGLLYCDGLDALGRPVVVVNADAVAEDRHARRAAFQYLLYQLEPIVVQGPYVLVMVNTGRSHKSNRVNISWLVSAHRGLSRPFRKNVKYIILVRPSKPLKAFLTVLKPFLSRKAHRKVVKVESLSGIAEATKNEVTLQHLGSRFATAAGRSVSDDLSLSTPTLRGGSSSPTFAH